MKKMKTPKISNADLEKRIGDLFIPWYAEQLCKHIALYHERQPACELETFLLEIIAAISDSCDKIKIKEKT